MIKRIMVFLISLLLILNSTLTNAYTFNQWLFPNNPIAINASMLFNGSKGAVTSSVLITPNATQVAKVLRSGGAGFALSYAVDQLLDAVDWVLDPANNQIRYQKPANPIDPANQFLYEASYGSQKKYVSSFEEACKQGQIFWNPDVGKPNHTAFETCYLMGTIVGPITGNRSSGSWGSKTYNPNYKPATLSLETVAQKVIENAQNNNIDAQFAVLAAANNILSEAENDDAKAKPIEDELERNKDPKCNKHNINMDSQAAYVKQRYDDMYADRFDQYNKYPDEANPLILNGKNKGSWAGHITQYRIAQVDLSILIKKASNDGCPATPNAQRWVKKDPPPKPGEDSIG
ncbi:hypothetical protein [Acinetobacter sp. Marseille-Q1618]|uniref:hypothetical protein n=1 Tax=Acinetobacter sp. Marseille-Q1618 TaxID=2697502 RepID=UPI00156FD894|nr:hypothetical protein [Acinetobacter sp. Marseille-Q1618]